MTENKDWFNEDNLCDECGGMLENGSCPVCDDPCDDCGNKCGVACDNCPHYWSY